MGKFAPPAIFMWILLAFAAPAAAQQKVTIGYFAEWPLPLLYGEKSGALGKATGAKISWQAFRSSGDLVQALADGSVTVALSLGPVPVLLAQKSGMDIRVIGISAIYPGSQGCIGRVGTAGAGITAADLTGKTVALPVGTLSHFLFLKHLAALSVNVADVRLLDSTPRQAFGALKQGKVDMACGWGPAYLQFDVSGPEFTEFTAPDIAAQYVFDTITILGKSEADYAGFLGKFLNETDRLNAQYLQSPDDMIAQIAKASGLTGAATKAGLGRATFPTTDQSLAIEWFGGGLQTRLDELARFFVEQATFDTLPDNLDTLVNPAFLVAAKIARAAEPAPEPAATDAATQ